MRSRFRLWLRRLLLSLLEVPAASDDPKADSSIADWFNSAAGHIGFHHYIRTRDRALVEHMMKLPIETEKERVLYYQAQGARIEHARLLSRAQAERSKKAS